MTLPTILCLPVYVGAAVWLTWPLGAQIGDGVSGTGPFTITDILYSMWAMAWGSHSLMTAPAQLPNANIYHPSPHALFYGPNAFGGLPLFAPVFWTTNNPVLATNVVFLGGIALTAWTTHIVVRRWTGSELAGIVAAATILANGWLVRGFVARTPHMAVLQYLPLIAFAAATPAARLRDAVPLLMLIVVQSLTDCVYVAPAVFAVIGPLAIARFLRRETRAAGMRLVIVLALAAIALAPLYAGYALVRSENQDLAQQSVHWTLPPTHRLPQKFLDPERGPALFLPPTIALVVLGLVAMAARRRSAGATPDLGGWRHGALWTIVGIVISLSPIVIVQGKRVWVPQMLIAPVYAHLRDPGRLGTVAMVGSAILAGMAFAELVRWIDRIGRRRAIAAVGRAGLAAAAIVPLFAGYGAAVPGTFPIVRLEPRKEILLDAVRDLPGPVVEVPTPQNWTHGLAMYNSLFHWHPLLNGYSSYYPKGFKERMALVQKLPDPDALATLRADAGLATLWVHLSGLPLPDRAPWLDLARTGRADLALVVRAGDDMVFRVQSPTARAPGSPSEVDVNDDAVRVTGGR